MAAELSSVVKRARQVAGLTQAQLAGRAGISASYLSRIEGAAWERGGPWPADGVLRALARALGLSSTHLLALRRAAEAAHTPTGSSEGTGRLAGRAGRASFAVSVGHEEVDGAARRLVEANPAGGTLRSVQVFLGERRPARHGYPASYLDALGAALAADPDAILFRVDAAAADQNDLVEATAERLAGGRPPGEAANVRARVVPLNPLVVDVLIGDNEVLVAVPDRRGHPRLRAGIVVDDPDFVAALRAWFDESVWDPQSEGPALPARARRTHGAAAVDRHPPRPAAIPARRGPAATS